MSSPVVDVLKTILKIDRLLSKPVFLQVAHQISDAVQRGVLPSCSRLPGTRNLAGILGIHRKTAVAVYDELESQGWIKIVPNKGAFVLAQKNLIEGGSRDQPPQKIITKPEGGFSFTVSNILDNPFEPEKCKYFFTDGIPDIRLYQASGIARYYSATLTRKQNEKKLRHYNAEGSEFFKHNLIKYLNETRGLNMGEENLLVTRSAEMNIYILSEILLDSTSFVIVGTPGHFAANMIFSKSGASILTVPVDEDGMLIEEIDYLCKKHPIRLVYVAPQRHYPTTVTLSATRRIHLQALAQKYGFIILEDDSDYEFQYEAGGMLPLASADNGGMVVHIGTFGKSLAPGFRSGYTIASQRLISEMKKYLGVIDRQGDIIMELTLGELISEGEIKRHLKKSLQIYKSRRDFFFNDISLKFGGRAFFEIPSGGLALWMQFKNPVNLVKLSSNCNANNLFIPRNLLYQTKDLCAMRIGFGHLTQEEISSTLGILINEFDKLGA